MSDLYEHAERLSRLQRAWDELHKVALLARRLESAIVRERPVLKPETERILSDLDHALAKAGMP